MEQKTTLVPSVEITEHISTSKKLSLCLINFREVQLLTESGKVIT